MSFSSSSQDLYDINSITNIEINFFTSIWDQILDNYYGTEQRLLANVLINGIPYDSVGVKFKGNSTYNENSNKNPINIKLDYTFNQDYQGYYTLKLSNGEKDPSFIREVLSYDILSDYMKAPKANYAKVYINGTYIGLYSNIESINKKFVSENFLSNSDNPLFKCNPSNLSFTGSNSSLEYLGNDTILYYDYYEMQSDYGWEELKYLTYTLNNDFNSINNILNVDRALWMLAFDNLFVNLDSYIGNTTQNYYLFKDDNDQFNAIIWDLNESFGRFVGGSIPGGQTTLQYLSEYNPLADINSSNKPLISQLLSNNTYQKMYIAHMRTMLNEKLTSNYYLQLADSLQYIIDSEVFNDPNYIYAYTDFQDNLYTSVGNGFNLALGLEELINLRISYLQNNSLFQSIPPDITDVIHTPSNPSINSSVAITAKVSNQLLGASAIEVIIGYRNHESEYFSKISMFDDGNHGDGIAGDGEYGVIINTNASNIQYYIYAENTYAGVFSPERAEHQFYTIPVNNGVVINELMASNISSYQDQDGEYDDWIELYNNSSSAIILDGSYISDNPSELKYQFPPNTLINANDYLIIWADKDSLQNGLHANFKLSSSGESVHLFNSSGIVINEVFFGGQNEDISYARVPNGTGDFINQHQTASYNNNNISIEEKCLMFKIFPNPATNYISINNNNNNNNNSSYNQLYKIYDFKGQLIDSAYLLNSKKIDISDFKPGIYLVVIDIFVEKLIIY